MVTRCGPTLLAGHISQFPLPTTTPPPHLPHQVSEAAGFLSGPAWLPALPRRARLHTTACQATAIACKPEDLIGWSRAY